MGKYNDSDINDDGKLYRRYVNKKANAKKEGLECNLTYDQYCDLVREGGYKSSDLGFTGNNIVLARYNDTGNYEVGNCRFITQTENAREKVVSLASRIASKENIQKYNSIRYGTEFQINYNINYTYLYGDDEYNLEPHRCEICGKKVSSNKKWCKECYLMHIDHMSPKPPRDELKRLIRKEPFTYIGSIFDVSDNAVRNWCKSYNLPYQSSEIRKISDEEWELI